MFPCANWNINSGIVPVPKMGNLTICTNYRGISLNQIAAKVYNRMILNIIRPVIDSLLCPTQNGFRPAWSTSSDVLALHIITVEVRNHKKMALIILIDFNPLTAEWALRALIDFTLASARRFYLSMGNSLDRKGLKAVWFCRPKKKLLKILLAYGIPPEIGNAIRVIYENTSALEMKPEGNSDVFPTNPGILQGDPLAPILFVICLDCALRRAIGTSAALPLKKKR